MRQRNYIYGTAAGTRVNGGRSWPPVVLAKRVSTQEGEFLLVNPCPFCNRAHRHDVTGLSANAEGYFRLMSNCPGDNRPYPYDLREIPPEASEVGDGMPGR